MTDTLPEIIHQPSGPAPDEAAERLLTGNDLVPATRLVYASGVPEGVVTSTEPGSATALLRGSTVTLVVSRGLPTVPAIAAGTAVDEAQDAGMLIGFRYWSRSHRDATPPLGEWDHRRSWIRLNGEPVPPPAWKKPGRRGDHEDPLIDEGYAYRTPTPVKLRAGWNRILVKAPVGKDGVKWMFTAALVQWDGERVSELEGATYAIEPRE